MGWFGTVLIVILCIFGGGDNGNAWVWFAVMLVNAMPLFGIVVYNRKKAVNK